MFLVKFVVCVLYLRILTKAEPPPLDLLALQRGQQASDLAALVRGA